MNAGHLGIVLVQKQALVHVAQKVRRDKEIILDHDHPTETADYIADPGYDRARQALVGITKMVLGAIAQQGRGNLPRSPDSWLFLLGFWAVAINDDWTLLKTFAAHQTFYRPLKVIRPTIRKNHDGCVHQRPRP